MIYEHYAYISLIKMCDNNEILIDYINQELPNIRICMGRKTPL